jgi:hypothetical protein
MASATCHQDSKAQSQCECIQQPVQLTTTDSAPLLGAHSHVGPGVVPGSEVSCKNNIVLLRDTTENRQFLESCIHNLNDAYIATCKDACWKTLACCPCAILGCVTVYFAKSNTRELGHVLAYARQAHADTSQEMDIAVIEFSALPNITGDITHYTKGGLFSTGKVEIPSTLTAFLRANKQLLGEFTNITDLDAFERLEKSSYRFIEYDEFKIVVDGTRIRQKRPCGAGHEADASCCQPYGCWDTCLSEFDRESIHNVIYPENF